MKQTTVAHMIIEKLAEQGINLEFPPQYGGNLLIEHDFAMRTDGFDLINRFPDLFHETCDLIDQMIELGECHFTDEGIVVYH